MARHLSDLAQESAHRCCQNDQLRTRRGGQARVPLVNRAHRQGRLQRLRSAGDPDDRALMPSGFERQRQGAAHQPQANDRHRAATKAAGILSRGQVERCFRH